MKIKIILQSHIERTENVLLDINVDTDLIYALRLRQHSLSDLIAVAPQKYVADLVPKIKTLH